MSGLESAAFSAFGDGVALPLAFPFDLLPSSIGDAEPLGDAFGECFGDANPLEGDFGDAGSFGDAGPLEGDFGDAGSFGDAGGSVPLAACFR